MTITARVMFLSGAFIAAAAITAAQAPQAPPGAPLPGISPVEFDQFRLGLDDFLEVETAEEGLGPAFNATSCAACHNVPAIGGVGNVAEMRAGRHGPDGTFQPLFPSPGGESLIHLFSIPNHTCQPAMPDGTTIVARRIPIPLFGAGLVEAIPDETLRALEDPIDRNGDGVRGRASSVVDLASGEQRIGRFGWKAQHATLLAFGADAYRNEMGITNDLFAGELAFGVSAEQMRLCDPIPDPEDRIDPRTRRRGIDNFASFMRFLAPVPRGTTDDQARSGELVFAALGCATCHVPSLSTGPSSNPLFHRRAVPLFSDLLLHDIGTGDGISQASAGPGEIRTPALWGLRLRRPFLHDGSATTIEDAIRRHAGEAELAREGFERLSESDRAMLLGFLRSL